MYPFPRDHAAQPATAAAIAALLAHRRNRRRAGLLEKYGTTDPDQLRARLAPLADVLAAEVCQQDDPVNGTPTENGLG